jgi:PPOX class probable F420-dependent enzyme
MGRDPRTQLDPAYSSPKAAATPWTKARRILEKAGVFWVSTVRPDGRPHVTPLVAVWLDGSLYFSTGPREVKAKNLARNPRCILTTGCNAFRKGLDVVVEGKAAHVTDEPLLRRLAALWARKYDNAWNYEVRDGAFHHESGRAVVFRLTPRRVLSYGRGRQYTATRYRFQQGHARRARGAGGAGPRSRRGASGV